MPVNLYVFHGESLSESRKLWERDKERGIMFLRELIGGLKYQKKRERYGKNVVGEGKENKKTS